MERDREGEEIWREIIEIKVEKENEIENEMERDREGEEIWREIEREKRYGER